MENLNKQQTKNKKSSSAYHKPVVFVFANVGRVATRSREEILHHAVDVVRVFVPLLQIHEQNSS